MKMKRIFAALVLLLFAAGLSHAESARETVSLNGEW